jgi:pimeloyl-ACP methyl ester carboxylesterase
MNQDIRFCKSADGVRLAYAVSGEGSPLVMSATWLTHLEHQWRSMAWRPWLDVCSHGHKLLRYDSRGCGLSDRDTDDFSFENWLRDFECVIEAAGLRRFSLLGTCWGGPIAIEYAARHPERVDRLILYGTYARGRMRWNDRPQEIEKAKLLLDLTRLGWGRENHAFQQVWTSHFQPGGTLEHLRSWSDQQRAATSSETAVRLLRIGWNVDVTEAARKIKCPVLIVHPERDAVVPIEEGRLLASLIPDAASSRSTAKIICRSQRSLHGLDWSKSCGGFSRNRALPLISAVVDCRSVNSPRASAPCLKGSPKGSTIRRLPHHSNFRRKRFVTTSRGCSTKLASNTVIRPLYGPAMQASE